MRSSRRSAGPRSIDGAWLVTSSRFLAMWRCGLLERTDATSSLSVCSEGLETTCNPLTHRSLTEAFCGVAFEKARPSNPSARAGRACLFPPA